MPMVDLHGQYLKIKQEVDEGIQEVLAQSAFINGPAVKEFQQMLSDYLGGCHVITCGNGTDALQIALMALNLQPGDEVIVPAFTYVASIEVIALLGLTPVLVDVDYNTFNINLIEQAISSRTRAIIPVHLFGQSCDMEPLLELASKHGLYVVEDNAQAIGAEYTFSDGRKVKTGTMGIIGCTSFFPSKNLGCYGDGGALFCHDDALAERIRMISNHGQRVKYHHDIVGCNSRLDTLQAAVLKAKLPHLDAYNKARASAADYYTAHLSGLEGIVPPTVAHYSSHVFHQYTLKIKQGRRDALKVFLAEKGIPSMIYYPLPLQEQKAYRSHCRISGDLGVASTLCQEVLSLPMHTELTTEQQDMVIESIKSFIQP